MAKKISAIILALVLCLSVMVVPTSASELADGMDVAFELKWDKEYYNPGDTATLSVYMKVTDDMELGTGSFIIGLNSAQITQADNPVDDIKANAVGSNLWNSFWKEPANATVSWLTATIVSKVQAKNTEAENALYDQYMKIVIARNTSSGTHTNATTLKNGLPGSDINALEEPIITFSYVVSANATEGVALNAAITSGSLTSTPAQTAFKYIKTPGTASTTANVATTAFDVSAATATATVGKEPCAEDAHVWDNGTVTTDPTCGAEGVKTFTCSACNSTKTEAVAATGNHTASDAVQENIVPASCNTAGSYESVVYCSVCGDEISRTPETIDATGNHNYATEKERVEATCTVDGYVIMACGCGAEEKTTLPATGMHTEETIDAVPATCEAAGSTAGVKCSVCGTVITAPTTVDALGHDMQETTAAVAPTCTAAGSTAVLTCANGCGKTEGGEEVAATGHNYEEKVLKTPTCTAEGRVKHTCSVCGDSYETKTEPKGHIEVVDPGVEPTCTTPGYKDGTKCSVCNAQVVVREKIPETGHAKENGVVTEPTYTEKGYTTYTCPTCGVTFKDDYVPKLEVDANLTIAIREPSITSIRCQDTMVLHAKMADGSEIPEGVTIKWTADNENFKTNEINDGSSLEITSIEDGYTVFTATVYDASGNVISSDSIEMYSKANIWGKIGGFFRSLFGSTLYYNY